MCICVCVCAQNARKDASKNCPAPVPFYPLVSSKLTTTARGGRIRFKETLPKILSSSSLKIKRLPALRPANFSRFSTFYPGVHCDRKSHPAPNVSRRTNRKHNFVKRIIITRSAIIGRSERAARAHISQETFPVDILSFSFFSTCRLTFFTFFLQPDILHEATTRGVSS